MCKRLSVARYACIFTHVLSKKHSQRNRKVFKTGYTCVLMYTERTESSTVLHLAGCPFGGYTYLETNKNRKICTEIGRESQDDGEVSGCPGN